MYDPRMLHRRHALLILAVGAAGCSLLTSLDGLTGDDVLGGDGGTVDGSQPSEDGSSGQGATDASFTDASATDAVADAPNPTSVALVVAGGTAWDGGGDRPPLDSTAAALLYHDGGLGPWLAGPALTFSGVLETRVASVGTRAMVLGAGVLSAELQASGALAPWEFGTTFPERFSHCSASAGDAVYLMGGVDGSSTKISLVNDARVGASPLTWASTSSLPSGRIYLGCAGASTFVYAVGGKDESNTHLDAVLVATRDATGALGAWQPTTPLPSAVLGARVVVVGSSLFVVGGGFDALPSTSVLFATIGSDGKLGAWKGTSALPVNREGASVAAFGDRLFVTGGAQGAALAEVFTARVDASGIVGGWNVTTPMPDGRMSHGSAFVVRF